MKNIARYFTRSQYLNFHDHILHEMLQVNNILTLSSSTNSIPSRFILLGKGRMPALTKVLFSGRNQCAHACRYCDLLRKNIIKAEGRVIWEEMGSEKPLSPRLQIFHWQRKMQWIGWIQELHMMDPDEGGLDLPQGQWVWNNIHYNNTILGSRPWHCQWKFWN